MSASHACAPSAQWMFNQIAPWFAQHARPLPWREPGTTPWGVLVSEIMSQQTPVARVEPQWHAWMSRWPTPMDLARADSADVIAAWGRLGYPRRAMRLHECAQMVTRDYGGVVPRTYDELIALPGIGSYTADAVLAFAFGQRVTVMDTNIRRVLGRVTQGMALPRPSMTRGEYEHASTLVPADDAASVLWNVGIMELGALVCSARSPICEQCPLIEQCLWREAGYPPDEFASRRRRQAWQGTDRQARGQVVQALREVPREVGLSHCCVMKAATLPGANADQAPRVLTSLLTDGLVWCHGEGDDARYYLGTGPSASTPDHPVASH